MKYPAKLQLFDCWLARVLLVPRDQSLECCKVLALSFDEFLQQEQRNMVIEFYRIKDTANVMRELAEKPWCD